MSTIMINIVEQLNAMREASKQSQSELAERAGLSRMTVVRTEHGQIDPRLSTIQVMARALGLELMLVPQELTGPLLSFIQAGGKYLGQEQGIDAPLSVVDSLLARERG
ncbi:helix-turn-helix domain-containing protein [Undibacterium pigrum]|uniref:Helix-turn-helix protein n=1 Tax=Undibacterium pigrum TaxID=401470 RepID=A0A318J1L3_9BURK|nr:helix-turn-helix domain-containing protein [Undibacterium pigrum]PXX41475.1 helix-turn-helix protein [Undibacterium pigrum]